MTRDHTPSLNASPAEVLYCAYQRGGPSEDVGAAWDGRPTPTWAELTERAQQGHRPSQSAIAKWEAVAAEKMDPVTEALEQLKTDLMFALEKAQHHAEFEALAREVDDGDPTRALEMARALERKVGLHPDVTYYKVLAQRVLASGGEE